MDSLHFRDPPEQALYGRDKSGREIDFVIRRSKEEVDVYECKMSPGNVDVVSIRELRSLYPFGEKYVVESFIRQTYRFSREGLVLKVAPLSALLVRRNK